VLTDFVLKKKKKKKKKPYSQKLSSIYKNPCFSEEFWDLHTREEGMGKSKVLVVGGTGYIGRRMVMASLSQGHTTYVLQRPETGLDIDKAQMLLSFKKHGARLVEGSFSDHRSLVDAVKLVDVVICTMSGVHFRSHNLLLQLQLVEAIKEAGNIKVCMYVLFLILL
jgi:hypothetical protein